MSAETHVMTLIFSTSSTAFLHPSWIFHTSNISSALLEKLVVQTQALFDFSLKLFMKKTEFSIQTPHGYVPNGFHLFDFWHKLEVIFLIPAGAN